MHENEISMHENEISMHDNEISMHDNEISMHENEIYVQKCMKMSFSCMEISYFYATTKEIFMHIIFMPRFFSCMRLFVRTMVQVWTAKNKKKIFRLFPKTADLFWIFFLPSTPAPSYSADI